MQFIQRKKKFKKKKVNPTYPAAPYILLLSHVMTATSSHGHQIGPMFSGPFQLEDSILMRQR